MNTLSTSPRARRLLTVGFVTCVLAVLGTRTSQDVGASVSANKTPSAEVAAAALATVDASSFACDGTAVDGNIHIRFQVAIGQTAATGSIEFDKQPAEVRRLFVEIYSKATQGFYSVEGLPHDPAELLANHWIESLPGSSGYSQLELFVDAKQLVNSLLPTDGVSGVRSAGQATIGGVRTNVFKGTFDGLQSTVYVAAHGTPRLVRIDQPSHKDGGTVTFSDYNEPVHVQTPSNVLTNPSNGGTSA